MKISILASAAIIAILLIVAGCSSKKASQTLPVKEVTMFKALNCGCCGVYSQYMEKEGFNVNVRNMESLDAIKAQYKIPSQTQSCHTTIVGNYFVEGHVPVEAIEKLLNEKPDIAGIALPGMPAGTPGMTGKKTNEWIVYAVKHDGTFEKFMSI